jgi:uncharacterized protein YndB with AHSA1/START domain
MVWTRQLRAPVDQVWALVSSAEGLSKWWLSPPTTFELRPGGAFSHHWDNVILDFNEREFINLDGMRFELNDHDGVTRFAFIDTWRENAVPPTSGLGSEQPGGPGTPWAGVAAGWHGTLDALEAALTGKPREELYEARCRYYAGYLRDYFRWSDVVRGELSSGHAQ